MDKTIDSINKIITELVEPEIKLKDTLLKVQVLAFKIKSEKLKEWVSSELNGFVGKKVPVYRKIPCAVYGNLIQDRGFGKIMMRNSQPLPIEYLDTELRESLMGIMMPSSVSELESMISNKGNYQHNLPYFIYNEITKIIGNDWVVDSAWQTISLNNIEGIISAIKSSLLDFLLKLAEEIGENDNIEIMKKENINNLFDKTIGDIKGENINITIGADNVVNTGDNSNTNIVKGENINQSIDVQVETELKDFITQLKKIEFASEDKEDIENEISRIESQVTREKPKYPIINNALSVIKGITSTIGNAMSPKNLEKLDWLIEKFN